MLFHSYSRNIRGVPIENYQTEIATALKLSVFDSILYLKTKTCLMGGRLPLQPLQPVMLFSRSQVQIPSWTIITLILLKNGSFLLFFLFQKSKKHRPNTLWCLQITTTDIFLYYNFQSVYPVAYFSHCCV